MSEHPAYSTALETRARQIAADMAALVKDPTGARLPDDLWRQCLPRARAEPFQARVAPWMDATFGPEIAGDKMERAHRFLEEALELVQSTGTTASEAHQLVDYVYGRSIGETHQEVGGVMVTLAALCLAHALDMHEAAETELARVWTKVDQIRAKQAAKPRHSPLPEQPGRTALRWSDLTDAQRERVRDAVAARLGEAMDCTRVWSAWGYGTMSEDDFEIVAEAASRLEEISEAAFNAALNITSTGAPA